MLQNKEGKIIFKAAAGGFLIAAIAAGLIWGLFAKPPQYQKAVETSFANEAAQILGAAYAAQQRHMLASGGYASAFSELDTPFPNAQGGVMETENFTFNLLPSYITAESAKGDYTLTRCYHNGNTCCGADAAACPGLTFDALGVTPQECCR
ncbi:MAG: hypothetical protein LBR90_02540 [Elusimicrobiota bacterium]|jgi:hypothetical protein|nr:hypothetical protein [Elusimicrobiota bacterium]